MSTITVAQWVDRLERLTGGGLVTELRKTLARAGLVGEAIAKQAATTSPRSRSGRLRASIGSKVEFRSNDLALVLSAGGAKGGGVVRYAALQEFGGTVRPTRAKWLAIPVGPALTGAGVPRYPGPRSVPGLSFVKSRSSQTAVLVSRETGQVFYVLKKSVRIPAHMYLTRGRDRAVLELRRELPVTVRTSFERGV